MDNIDFEFHHDYAIGETLLHIHFKFIDFPPPFF